MLRSKIPRQGVTVISHTTGVSLIFHFLLFSFFSCLRAIRQLQKNGHIPSDASLFKSYAEYGHFVDVRIAALEALVDYTRGKGICHKYFFFLVIISILVKLIDPAHRDQLMSLLQMSVFGKSSEGQDIHLSVYS